MRHSPYYAAYQNEDNAYDDTYDDDDGIEDNDFDESADEDDEEELLLAAPAGQATQLAPAPWKPRDAAGAAILVVACGVVSAATVLGSWTLLRRRAAADLLGAMLVWAIFKWLGSRVLLCLTGQAPLRFSRCAYAVALRHRQRAT